MNKNFVKCTSENLPKVDLEMLLEYISNNECFQSTEMRGVKTLRSMRQNYGNEAIGYVQLLREGSICTVEAKICPEHKVRNKNYTVQVIIDENEERVIKAECRDCAASQGGCKHAVALLAWIYRKSEEPSPTSVTCYWRKPLLSSVGTSIKYKKIVDICNPDKNDGAIQQYDSNDFLKLVLQHESSENIHLLHFFKLSDLKKLSLHYQAISYKGDRQNVTDFKDYCSEFLNMENVNNVNKVTSDQCNSVAWYELRYGRITASVVHEAAHCTTPEGCLVEKIMSMKNIDTIAMKRGRELENEVLKLVGNYLRNTFNEKSVIKSGLLLRKEFPMLGASPDGLTDNAVIEIKCPFKEKSMSRYFKENKIMSKFKTQLQVQMFFANKPTGYFCVADPDFEKNKKINILKESFDKKYVMDVMQKAVKFWEEHIFPKLMK